MCSKTFKTQPSLPVTLDSTCLLLKPNLTFICFYLLSASPRETSDAKRGENINENEHSKRCSVSLLTVDNHVDVFDVRRGDVVAGLAFVATRLVSHDAYDVQVLLSVQRFCCREREKTEGRRRSD